MKREQIADIAAKFYPLPIKSIDEIKRMEDWCDKFADEVMALPCDQHPEWKQIERDFVEWDKEGGFNASQRQILDWFAERIKLKALDVPSDEEIENYLWEEIHIPLSDEDRLNNTEGYKIYKETFLWIRWMRDEIIKRNVK